MGLGAAAYPIRHPVMAYVFDIELSSTIRSRASGQAPGRQ